MLTNNTASAKKIYIRDKNRSNFAIEVDYSRELKVLLCTWSNI